MFKNKLDLYQMPALKDVDSLGAQNLAYALKASMAEDYIYNVVHEKDKEGLCIYEQGRLESLNLLETEGKNIFGENWTYYKRKAEKIAEDILNRAKFLGKKRIRIRLNTEEEDRKISLLLNAA